MESLFVNNEFQLKMNLHQPERAAELTHNIYQLKIVLPESKYQKSILLQMDDEQSELYKIILKHF